MTVGILAVREGCGPTEIPLARLFQRGGSEPALPSPRTAQDEACSWRRRRCWRDHMAKRSAARRAISRRARHCSRVCPSGARDDSGRRSDGRLRWRSASGRSRPRCIGSTRISRGVGAGAGARLAALRRETGDSPTAEQERRIVLLERQRSAISELQRATRDACVTARERVARAPESSARPAEAAIVRVSGGRCRTSNKRDAGGAGAVARDRECGGRGERGEAALTCR